MKVIRVDSFDGNGDLKAALMSDSTVRPDGRPLFLPHGDFCCHIRPVVRIDRLGKAISERFAARYYGEVALVNYLCPRELSAELTFDIMDDAVVLGRWIPIDRLPLDIAMGDSTATLAVDRSVVDRLIEKISAQTTLKTGDLLILPHSLFVFSPEIGRHIIVETVSQAGPGEVLLDFTIK